MLIKSIRAIFATNLDVKQGEKILIFTDRVSDTEVPDARDFCRRERLRDTARLTAEVGKAFTKKILYHEYPATGSHGAEPPDTLWDLAFGEKVIGRLREAGLLGPILRKEISDELLRQAEGIIDKNRRSAVNAVIALSNYSTSHTRFRNFLTRICGCRYASMPLFDISMFEGCMNVDWKALARRCRSIERVVNRAETIEVRTPNGTSLTLSKQSRKAISDTGILTGKGAFGNLPAGEVFLAPLEGTAKGKLVVEWGPTRVLASPVSLMVKDGLVREVIGEEPYADFLRAKLNERDENRNIAELGIGANHRAKRPDNLLEAEKILGTIHIALGDNSTFGGEVKTPFHQDLVFSKPTVVLRTKDNEEILLLEKGVMKI